MGAGVAVGAAVALGAGVAMSVSVGVPAGMLAKIGSFDWMRSLGDTWWGVG